MMDRVLAKVGLIVLSITVGSTAQAISCTDADIVLSADGHSYHVPLNCTSLTIDGDHPRSDLLIASLEHHPTLSELTLSRDVWRAYADGGLTLDHALALAEVLPNTLIHSLDVSFNGAFGNAGVEVLAGVLGSTKVKRLDLHSTGFGEGGMKALAAAIAKDDSHLEDLNVARNFDFGEAASHLVEAVKKHSKLAHINDEGTTLKTGGSEHEGSAVRSLLKGECHATPWTQWSPCEGECGAKSTVKRTRQILHRPHERHLPKGEPCPHDELDEKPCKVRCLNGKPVSSAAGSASTAAAAAATKPTAPIKPSAAIPATPAKEVKEEPKPPIKLATAPAAPVKEDKKEEPVESSEAAANSAQVPKEAESSAQSEVAKEPTEAEEEEAEELAV